MNDSMKMNYLKCGAPDVNHITIAFFTQVSRRRVTRELSAVSSQLLNWFFIEDARRHERVRRYI